MEVFRDKFVDVIHGLELEGPVWGDVCRVADLLNILRSSGEPRSGPLPGLLRNLFPSYVSAITDMGANYYLCTVEILALCKCAGQNVIIVRRLGNALEYDRHFIADPTRPVVLTSIITNNVGAVRSHFERVISVADVRRQHEFCDTIDAERQQKKEEWTRMQAEDENIVDNATQAPKIESQRKKRPNFEASNVPTNVRGQIQKVRREKSNVNTEEEDDETCLPEAAEASEKGTHPEDNKENEKSKDTGDVTDCMDAPQPFYHVRAMDRKESGDPRAAREGMLLSLIHI